MNYKNDILLNGLDSFDFYLISDLEFYRFDLLCSPT